LQTSDNNSSRQIVYNKIEKKSSRVIEITVVVWLVRVATTTSGHADELVPLRVTGAGYMNMLHQLKNSKKINKNEETESLMIGNVPELIEAAQREVVVGEVAAEATKFLAAAPFAIHDAMQLVLKVLICAR
jgi:hypothetical protein